MDIIPYNLTPDQINKFREIYKKQFQEVITYEEAKVKGNNLVHFLSVMLELIASDKEKLQRTNKAIDSTI